MGVPLALAAAATAAGFFSFLPTTYTGVAELGMVAGIGMIVAFLLSITLLPALLRLGVSTNQFFIYVGVVIIIAMALNVQFDRLVARSRSR